MGERTWAVFAAGGTAGHIFPALQIANEVRRRGFSSHFVSSKRGMGEFIDIQNEFSVTYLEGRGLVRKLRPAALINNLKAMREVLSARRRALKLLKELKPSVVVCLGGYAGMPCALAAKKLKLPVIVVEPNATPGLVNKRVSRWAQAAAVGFTECKLPGAVVTGIPVREEIMAVKRESNLDAAKKRLGVTGFLAVVLGGSLGSKKLNSTLVDSLEKLFSFQGLYIRHIVGARDWNSNLEKLMSQHPRYTAIKFEENMAELYESADLFICRAGAGMIAELSVTGVPSILIPLSGAPGNHQMANAEILAGKGGAEILMENQLNGESLVNIVSKYLSEPSSLKDMAENAKNEIHSQATSAIVDLMETNAVRQ